MNLFILALAFQPSAPLDFRGMPLGMTEAGFRAQSIEPGNYGPRRVVCSNDPDAPAWLSPPREDAEAGAYRCGVVENIAGSTLPASVELSPELTVNVRHLFYQGRLYQIAVHAPDYAAPTIEASLVQRFGAPTHDTTGVVQNRVGGVFPQRNETWIRGHQRISLITPFGSRNNMIVLYTDSTIYDQVQAAIRARRRPVM